MRPVRDSAGDPPAKTIRNREIVSTDKDKRKAYIFILACIGFIAAMFLGTMIYLKSIPAYKLGVETAIASAKVQEKIGAPVSVSFFAWGSSEFDEDNKGGAQIDTPISGPKGSGTLHVGAHFENGKWSLYDLHVKIGEQYIHLLDDVVQREKTAK